MAKRLPQKKKGLVSRPSRTPLKLHDPNSYEDANFLWRVTANYIDYDHPQLGWDRIETHHCLEVIIQGLHSYEGLVWREVRCKDHCHPWALDEIPNEFYKRLQQRHLDIDGLFQISLGGQRRVIGVKRGQFFYLMWYDSEHKFWPTKAE